MEQKIIFLDLDGTITDEAGRLPFESVKGIHKLIELGFKICIASANSYCIIRTLRRYFAITDYIIAENGGVIDYDGNIHLLTNRENILKAVNIIKLNFPNLKDSWTNSMRLTDYAFMRPEKKVIEDLKNFLDENKNLGVKIYDSGYSLQVINSDVDKSNAILKIINELKISIKNTYAIGDSETDLGMFKVVNFPIALNNSIDELKKLSKFVTKESYYRGFLEIIELIEKDIL
jgi:phosphoglycolate phosphatase (TIGR01487 family)